MAVIDLATLSLDIRRQRYPVQAAMQKPSMIRTRRQTSARENGTQLSADRLDLFRLLVFNTVVNEGTMSRAGERLFITQPAVSAHIKALEQELGVRLFDRVGRRSVVNPAGRVLYEKAQRLLTVAEDLKAAMSEL